MVRHTWYLVLNMAAALLLLPVSTAAGPHSCCSTSALLFWLNLSHTHTADQADTWYILVIRQESTSMSQFIICDDSRLRIFSHRPHLPDPRSSQARPLRRIPISSLDHRRLQANKLRTSMSNKTTKIVGFFHGIFQP